MYGGVAAALKVARAPRRRRWVRVGGLSALASGPRPAGPALERPLHQPPLAVHPTAGDPHPVPQQGLDGRCRVAAFEERRAARIVPAVGIFGQVVIENDAGSECAFQHVSRRIVQLLDAAFELTRLLTREPGLWIRALLGQASAAWIAARCTGRASHSNIYTPLAEAEALVSVPAP